MPRHHNQNPLTLILSKRVPGELLTPSRLKVKSEEKKQLEVILKKIEDIEKKIDQVKERLDQQYGKHYPIIKTNY